LADGTIVHSGISPRSGRNPSTSRRHLGLGGTIEEVRPGDIVWFPPGLKHWHGASPTTATTHIAIQESINGKNVDWMEKVSDDQYRR
jgi:hypothetical protein